MKRPHAVAAAILLLVSLAPGQGAAAPAIPQERVRIDTTAGQRTFILELAEDDASQKRGLMGRKHLAHNRGMLFDFHRPVMAAFWMKDTPIPLDMLFVRADGRISTIAANAVPYSQKEIISAEPIRAVIEIAGGEALRQGLQPGNIVHARAFGDAAHAGP